MRRGDDAAHPAGCRHAWAVAGPGDRDADTRHTQAVDERPDQTRRPGKKHIGSAQDDVGRDRGKDVGRDHPLTVSSVTDGGRDAFWRVGMIVDVTDLVAVRGLSGRQSQAERDVEGGLGQSDRER